MTKSTTSTKTTKAGRPYPGFPLWIHSSGRWCKKVKQKHYYFGYVADDPNGNKALELWLTDKDDLLAGRVPNRVTGGLTIADLCNSFLTHKDLLVQSGELTQRTHDRYQDNCRRVVEKFGKHRGVNSLQTADFQQLRASMARSLGAIALSNEIQMTRSLFRYGYEAGLLDVPLRFGPGFKKPSAKTIRMTRAAKGPKMFSVEEVRALLKEATPNLTAMVLLALNAGLGNTDVGMLPISAINMGTGWLDYPRTKTGIQRRVPLWSETIKAVHDAMAVRAEPIDPDDVKFVFIGKRGQNYIGKAKGYRVTAEFTRVAKRAGLDGRTFYDLRRTFQTIAEGAHDLVAVQSIMGHAPSSGDMSAIYRQKIEDQRLQAVVDYVHDWLFNKPKPR